MNDEMFCVQVDISGTYNWSEVKLISTLTAHIGACMCVIIQLGIS